MHSPVFSHTLETVLVVPDYDALCNLVADRITAVVQTKPEAVVGLATGSTPLGVYDKLVQRSRSGGLDFSRVTCFNLDEYYPMASDSPHSYHRFMQENLFSHVPCRRWSVPDGRLRTDAEIAQSCQDYEEQIAAAGGIDLQLLGIGRTGHIGFNEPGSRPDSRTRRVTLHATTRQDAGEAFGRVENVPPQAITMGIGTILEAREIVMMASGSAKADIVRSALTEEVTERVPASWVRTHPNAHVCLDEPAASRLSRGPG